MPRISICIPCYHGERYLTQALESVCDQTFSDWEVVLVEDGSKDRAEEIFNAFAQKSSQNFRYFRNEQNEGLPATRNRAIASAEGEYIALLDCDDYWATDHLQNAMETASTENADLIYAGAFMFDSDTGAVTGYVEPTEEELGNLAVSLYQKSFFQPSAAVLKKKSLKKVGLFDPRIRYCEDVELWFRCLRSGLKFAYTGHRTCYYRKHPQAMTSQAALMAEYKARAYWKHRNWTDIPAAMRRDQTAWHFEAAGRICYRKQPMHALGLFLEAWRAWPVNIKFPLFAVACIMRYVGNKILSLFNKDAT